MKSYSSRKEEVRLELTLELYPTNGLANHPLDRLSILPLFKEETGLEPTHDITTTRQFSRLVHYHYATLPL